MLIENFQKFWIAQPFPHIVLSDFIENREFMNLSNAVQHFQEEPAVKFNTNIETNKSTFNTLPEAKPIVETITNKTFLFELELLLGLPVNSIKPLTAFENHIYKFYHKMTKGGKLGAHVDHSYLDDYIHVSNCIYYISSCLEGGETFLGRDANTKVKSTANQLLIFLHDSHSFHGVMPIKSALCDRWTIYMDYYVKIEYLHLIQSRARQMNALNIPDWWMHKTTFVPRGKHFYKYLHSYFYYLLRKQFQS